MGFTLDKFLPDGAIDFVYQWLKGYSCNIKVTKSRRSKLGDYRKIKEGCHQISINGNLDKDLFFFVLSHEIAHLLAIARFGNILSHGKEWKDVFRQLLIDSIEMYDPDLRTLLLIFSRDPEANFMSSPDLVKIFTQKNKTEHQVYLEELSEGSRFIFQKQLYRLEEDRKKRYICRNLETGRSYFFKTCTLVEYYEE